MRTIAEIRADFEETDRRLGELLERRMALAGEMAEAKRRANEPVLQAERRREVMGQWVRNCPSYSRESVEGIYELLHNESVKKQNGI